jgi:hypothetical protein
MFGGIKGRRRGTTVHIKIIFFGSIVTIRWNWSILHNLEIQSLYTNKLTDNTEPLLHGKTEKNGEKIYKKWQLIFRFLFSFYTISTVSFQLAFSPQLYQHTSRDPGGAHKTHVANIATENGIFLNLRCAEILSLPLSLSLSLVLISFFQNQHSGGANGIYSVECLDDGE